MYYSVKQSTLNPQPASPASPVQVLSLVGGEQRTAEWHRLREKRLTASAFSKALGFFSGERLARLGMGGWLGMNIFLVYVGWVGQRKCRLAAKSLSKPGAAGELRQQEGKGHAQL